MTLSKVVGDLQLGDQKVTLNHLAVFFFLKSVVAYLSNEKTWLFRVHRGLYYRSVYRDFYKSNIRIPINQPGFNGKDRRVFFRGSLVGTQIRQPPHPQYITKVWNPTVLTHVK